MPKTLLAVILCTACVTSIACDDADTTTTADNRTAGDKVAEAGEKTGDALDRAADKAGEAIGKVTDDTVDLARKTRDQGQKAADAAGVVPNDAKSIQGVIAGLVEAAMQPGKFGEIVERLAQPDRARIGDYATKAHPDLADITGKADAAWKKAYGHALDIENVTASFGGAGALTLTADGKSATLPLGGMSVPFVRENTDWRVDAPDVLSGEGLKNALIKRLDAIGNGTTPLPKDETAGHALVAQQVLEAIMTTDQPKSPAVPLR